MFVRILIYIKHHLKFIWQGIEKTNSLLFSIIHEKKINKIIPEIFKENVSEGYLFRQLLKTDLRALELLINDQAPGRLDYFKPHDFDLKSLKKVFKNPSFIMMGAFDKDKLVGYFFLRCFWNKKCFVGRLIDEPYEGRGIGRVMNQIMYNIGWSAGFRVLSTISKNNKWVMRSHSSNSSMVVLKNLDNDFLFVEFKKQID